MKKISHIVIIDDNKIDSLVNQKLISFNYKNLTTTTFNNAATALQFFKKLIEGGNINLKQPVDMVLLDINMPQMSGFEFLKQLEAINGSYTNLFDVFILSSSKNEEDIQRALDSQYCAGYIIKPLNRFKLKKIIETNNINKGIIS